MKSYDKAYAMEILRNFKDIIDNIDKVIFDDCEIRFCKKFEIDEKEIGHTLATIVMREKPIVIFRDDEVDGTHLNLDYEDLLIWSDLLKCLQECFEVEEDGN